MQMSATVSFRSFRFDSFGSCVLARAHSGCRPLWAAEASLDTIIIVIIIIIMNGTEASARAYLTNIPSKESQRETIAQNDRRFSKPLSASVSSPFLIEIVYSNVSAKISDFLSSSNSPILCNV